MADDSETLTDRKRELLELVAKTALQENSSPISLRQFAIAAGVSEPTLRHHFEDRRGLVIALLRYLATFANDFLKRCETPGEDLPSSIKGYLDLAMEGVENDLFVRTHAFALVEAIHDPAIAQVYLETAIEPSLTAIEHRLAPLLDPNGEDPAKVRDTAFFLYAPMLASILHQRLLRGEHVRPLHLPDFFSRLTGWLTQTADE